MERNIIINVIVTLIGGLNEKYEAIFVINLRPFEHKNPRFQQSHGYAFMWLLHYSTLLPEIRGTHPIAFQMNPSFKEIFTRGKEGM